ncbi:MAG: hypothetical protein HY007_02655 [Candidatus Sungbacteria bacterium]|nr:hypothetical protein [Candidatus Sungbacteria bacterium]
MSEQIAAAERERYERAVQGLDQAIYELTWLGQLWGPRGVLALERTRRHYLLLLGRHADALSTTSSTFFAAGGDAHARARNYGFPLKIILLPVAKYFFERSFLLTKKLIRDYGYDQLSTNKVDFIAHGLTRKKYYEQATACMNIVLARPDATPNNKALMYRLAADIEISRGEYRLAERDVARALELRSSLGPETIIRILRTQALLEKARGNPANAERIQREIRQISREQALPGQDKKSQAGL